MIELCFKGQPMTTDHTPPPQTAAGLPVLIVGDVMLDRYLDGPVERISPEAPVPVLHVRRAFERAGGAGNVAANVAAMGGRPVLVGAIGHDPQAYLLKKVLGEADVDTASLIATPTIPTTTKTRLLAGHAQIARFDEEAPLTDAEAKERILAWIAGQLPSARVAVLSDYAKGVCDVAVCRAVIEGAARAGIPTIVDPKGTDFSRYRNADVITPNRSEAAAVVGFPIHSSEDAIRAAEAIRGRFAVRAVVVTLGEQGMVVVADGHVSVIPTQARGVFEVTGAGDTAVAMLAVALAEGMSLDEACVLANAAAGIQVSRIGAARITRSEVTAAIEAQSTLARGKVVDAETLGRVVAEARREGRRIGFTNGCFDILHHGHVALLEAAARECDVLVVGVNSDASVTRLKGAPRPFVPSTARQAVLAALSSVAWVCEFDGDSPLDLIRRVEPDVLVKGADYKAADVVGADIVLARGGRVVTPLFVANVSTTNIVDSILSSRKPSP
jgi:D-beta-D-heptose 7-phosphate kinase/D-beta-D-heptose 1-phosphate adenosyltransferase